MSEEQLIQKMRQEIAAFRAGRVERNQQDRYFSLIQDYRRELDKATGRRWSNTADSVFQELYKLIEDL